MILTCNYECVFPVGRDRETCQILSGNVRRNVQACCASKCASPHRFCIECIERKEENPHAAIDRESGLCEAHGGVRKRQPVAPHLIIGAKLKQLSSLECKEAVAVQLIDELVARHNLSLSDIERETMRTYYWVRARYLLRVLVPEVQMMLDGEPYLRIGAALEIAGYIDYVQITMARRIIGEHLSAQSVRKIMHKYYRGKRRQY